MGREVDLSFKVPDQSAKVKQLVDDVFSNISKQQQQAAGQQKIDTTIGVNVELKPDKSSLSKQADNVVNEAQDQVDKQVKKTKKTAKSEIPVDAIPKVDKKKAEAAGKKAAEEAAESFERGQEKAVTIISATDREYAKGLLKKDIRLKNTMKLKPRDNSTEDEAKFLQGLQDYVEDVNGRIENGLSTVKSLETFINNTKRIAKGSRAYEKNTNNRLAGDYNFEKILSEQWIADAYHRINNGEVVDIDNDMLETALSNIEKVNAKLQQMYEIESEIHDIDIGDYFQKQIANAMGDTYDVNDLKRFQAQIDEIWDSLKDDAKGYSEKIDDVTKRLQGYKDGSYAQLSANAELTDLEYSNAQIKYFDQLLMKASQLAASLKEINESNPDDLSDGTLESVLKLRKELVDLVNVESFGRAVPDNFTEQLKQISAWVGHEQPSKESGSLFEQLFNGVFSEAEQAQTALKKFPKQIDDWLSSNMGERFENLSTSEWHDTLDEYFKYAQQRYEEFEQQMSKSSAALTYAEPGTQKYQEADQQVQEATLGMGVFEHIRSMVGETKKLLDYIETANKRDFNDTTQTPDKVFRRIKEYRESILSMLKTTDILPQELKDDGLLQDIRGLVGDNYVADNDELPYGTQQLKQLMQNAQEARAELDEFNAAQQKAQEEAAEAERKKAAEVEQAAERERQAREASAKAVEESAQAVDASAEQDKKQADQAQETKAEVEKETKAMSEQALEAKRLRDEFNANPNKKAVNEIAKEFGISSTQIKSEMADVLSSSDSAEEKIQKLTDIIRDNVRYVKEADQSYKDLAESMKVAHGVSIPREDAEGALNIINGAGQKVPSLSAFRTKLGRGFSLQKGHDTSSIDRFTDEAFESAHIEKPSNLEEALAIMYDAQVTARAGIVSFGDDALAALQTDVEGVKSLLREKLKVKAPAPAPAKTQSGPEPFMTVGDDYEPFPWEEDNSAERQKKQAEQATSAIQENTKAAQENVSATSASASASEQHADQLEREKEAVAQESAAEQESTAATEADTSAKQENTSATNDEQKAKKDDAKASETSKQSTEAQTAAEEKHTKAKKKSKSATEQKTRAQKKSTATTAEAASVSQKHADSLKQEESAVAKKTEADKKQAGQVAKTETAVKAATSATQHQETQNQATAVSIQDINQALEDEQQLWEAVDQQQRGGQSAGTVGPDNYTLLAEQMSRSGASIADAGVMQSFLKKGIDKVDVAKNLEDALKQSLQRARHDNSFSNYLLSQFKLDESDVQNIQSVLQSAYSRIWDMFEKSSGSKRDRKTIASQIYGFEKLSGFGFQGEFDFDKIKSSIGYDSFKQNGSFVNEGKRAIADVWEMYDSIMQFIDRTQANLANTYQKLAAGASQYYRGIISGDQSKEFLAFKEDYERGISDASAAGVNAGQAGDAYNKYVQIKNQVLDLLEKEQAVEGRVLTAQEKSAETQAILNDIDYLHLEPEESAKPSYYDEQTDDIYEYVQAEKSLQQAEDEEAESVLAGAEQVEQACKKRSKFDEQLAQQKQGLDDYLAGKWDEQEAQTQAAAAEKELQRSRQEADSSSGTDQNPEDYWSAIHLDQSEDSLASRLTYAYEKRAKQKGLKSGYEEAIQWHNPTESENKAYELAKKEIGELDELVKRLTEQYESSQKAQIAAGKEYDEQAAKAVERAKQKEKSDEQFYKGVYAEAYKIGEDRYGKVISGTTKATKDNAEQLIKDYLNQQYQQFDKEGHLKGITDFNFKAGKIDLSGHEGISATFRDATGEAHKFYAALNTVTGEIRGMEGDAKSLNQAYQNLFGEKPRTEEGILKDFEKVYDKVAKIKQKEQVGFILTPKEVATLSDQNEQLKQLNKEVEKLGLDESTLKAFEKLRQGKEVAANKKWQTAYETQGENHLEKLYDNLTAQYTKVKELEAKGAYTPLSHKDQNALDAAKQKYKEILETLRAIHKIAPRAFKSKDWQLEQDAKQKMGGVKQILLEEEAAKQQKRYGNIFKKNVNLSNIQDVVTSGVNGKLVEDVKVQNIGNGIYKITTAYKAADGVVTKFNGTLNTTSGELRAIETAGVKGATSISQQIGMLKSDFSKVIGVFSRYLSGYQLIGYAKQQIQTVREIDSQFVELRKVSEDSTRSLEQFREKSFDIGRTVGQTSVDILNAAAQWEQLGYNIKETESLVQASVVFKNVADGMQNEQEATEDLISTMKAFHIEAEGAMDIVDALNEVSNSYSVSAQDLGKILKRSSATLAVGKNSMEQTLALGTAMNEIMQDAGVSGNALKILSLRLRGQKTEIAEAGEDTEGMVESTSKLQEKIKALTGGFDIMADANNFKSTYEIMKGIANVWDDLTDINRAALLELIAGKNRANAVASLLSNFEQVDNVINTIRDDEGSATRENLIRLDSINGRITLLKNSIQELSQAAIDSNFLKEIISDLTKLTNKVTDFVKAVDNIKLPFVDKSVSAALPLMSAMAGQRFGLRQGKSLFGFGNNPDSILNIGKAKFGNAQFQKTFGQDFSSFINGIDIARQNDTNFNLDKYLSDFRGNGKGLDDDLITRIKDLDNVSKSTGKTLIETSDAVKGLDSYMASGSMAVSQFTKGLKQAAITSLQFMAITAAIEAFVSITDEAIHHQERLNASFAEHSNNLKESNDKLAEYRNKVDTLNQVIKDEHSSLSEVAEARQELMTLQSEMIEAYGDEAKNIGESADAYERLAKAQYEAAKQSLIAGNNGIKENIIRFFKGEQNAYTELISTFENYEQDLSGLERYLPKDNDSIIKILTGTDHGEQQYATRFAGTIYDAVETFSDIRENIKQQFKAGIIDEKEYNNAIGRLESLNAKAVTAKSSGEYLYQAHVVEDVIEANSELKKQYKLLQDIGKQYDKQIKANDKNGMEDAVKQYAGVIDQVLSEDLTDGEVKAFKNIYPLLYEEALNWSFRLKFEPDKDELKDKIQGILDSLSGSMKRTVSADDLMNWDDQAHDATQNGFVSELGTIADENNLDFQQFLGQLKELGILFDQAGAELYDAIVQKSGDAAKVALDNLSESERKMLAEMDGGVGAYEKNLTKYSGDVKKAIAATVIEARKASEGMKKSFDFSGVDAAGMASDLSNLQKVYNDIKDGGKFTWSNVINKNFKDAFGDLDNIEGFEDAYQNLLRTIASTKDIDKAQGQFDDLASAYIYNSELMAKLDESNKAVVEGILGEGGIVNAHEMVEYQLGKNVAAMKVAELEDAAKMEGEESLASAIANGNEAIIGKIKYLYNEANMSQQAKTALGNLLIQENLLSGQSFDNSAVIQSLQQIASTAQNTTQQLRAMSALLNVAQSSGFQGMSAEDQKLLQQYKNISEVPKSLTHQWVKAHATYSKYKRGADVIMHNVGNSNWKTRAEYEQAKAAPSVDFAPVDTSSGGGGGGGGGGDHSDSKTDKEFDWISRFTELKQRQNDKLREVIDDQYTVYQNSIKQDEDYLKAQNRLAEAEKKLEELGVDPNNYTPTPADGKVHPREDTGEYPAGWMSAEDDIPQWLKDANVGGDMFDIADESAEDAAKAISKVTENTDEAYNEYLAAKEALEAYGEARVVEEKSQLDTLKELIQSDQDLIDSQQSVLDGYKAQWAEYQQQIADQWGDKAPQWIKDITEGNVHPEDWEAVYSYSSSDQAEKDRVESLERGKEAYDAMNTAEDELRKKIKQKLEDEQKEYEIRLNIVKAQQAQIQNLADIAQWELDMKGVLGEVVQESDYQALIDINDDLIANYEEQLDVLNEQLGTLDEGEQAWYDCQSSIYECENAIREARKQQAEWNDTILRLPVENMQRFLKLLQNIGKDLDNFMAVQEAMGKDTTADQISKQWADALDQITADQGGFNAQAEKWLDILENYDLGSDKFSEVDDSIQECEDSVTSLIESMVELNSQLLNLPIDKIAKMTEYLNGTLSDLQSVQSEFETAINSVINAITEEQDKLQKEYDDLEESINDQIKPLEDALDQLEKQNDQRNRQLAIEKAQLELAKQQEQHTLQVIRNGKVQYEQDQGAIRDAQEGLADAEYNKLIGDLNDQIDALNEQLEKASDKLDEDVKELQKILDERWETIMPDTETARNEEIATRIFGEGWKELVLAGKNANGVYADEAMYQAMRKAYEENSVQQRDVDDQIKTNELITSTLQKYVEDFQAEKLTAEEMSEKISTLMNIVNDNLVTGQEALRNTLTMGGYETLGNALQAANTLRENQLDVFNENLQIAQERRDQIDELTLDWEEFAKKFDEYREQLKSDWDAIDFIGEKVSYIQDNYDDDDDDNVTSYWDGPSERNPDDYRGDASYNDIGHYADGLENGQIGKLSSSDKFKAIQALGLKKLEPDEIPAILHAGEGVVNGRQQSNILSNMNGALSLGAGNKLGAMINISMGDLTLPNVTNGKEFAESLAQNFTPIMNQYFSKVFGK